jgi:hypothetical protein
MDRKMDGIIYKFTIIAKYKFNENKPFYIGQHWENKGKEHFLSSNVSNYPGSGKIWNDFMKRIKQDYPKNWRKLIRREVLFYSEICSQKCLDKMEEYYIKHEKSHYSYKLGGTNIAWGGNSSRLDESTKKKLSDINLGKKLSDETKKKMSESGKNKKLSRETKIKIGLSKIGDKNPMKNKEVSNKVSEKNKRKTPWNVGKKTSIETRKKLSESHKGKTPWNKGIVMSEESRKNLSEKLTGRKLSEKHRENIKKYVSLNHPFKGKHHSEETKIKLSKYFLGKSPGNKGKVCINNGLKNKYIFKDDKLPEGWEYGNKK